MRAASRNKPFYTTGAGTVFHVDIDGNGELAEQATVTVGGRPASVEQVAPGAPFVVGGQAFEIAAIDSAGTQMTVRPAQRQTAAAEGFKAPAMTGALLSGGPYAFPRGSKERVTLIEFWSTECGYSEKVRPAANALVASLPAADYRWIAVAPERERAALPKHVAEHPVSGTVVLADSVAWQTYNPEGVTPLFVVVDAKGVVRFRASGMSAMDAVATTVRTLLGQPAPRTAPAP